jgi:hypothetical protein
MSALDIAAIVILILLAVIAIAVFAFLGSWPGRVAKQRGHDYAEAIQVGGWATLVLGAVFWPLVLMWAYTGGAAAETAAKPAKTGNKES